jgi:hypothetical protein
VKQKTSSRDSSTVPFLKIPKEKKMLIRTLSLSPPLVSIYYSQSSLSLSLSLSPLLKILFLLCRHLLLLLLMSSSYHC